VPKYPGIRFALVVIRHSFQTNGAKMNRNLLSYGLVAAILATSVSFTAKADKQDEAAIIGAIIGGVLGNQVGKGNGKAVATGLGIILGAVIGSDIGKSLDQNDRRALEEAQRDAFRRPIGDRTEWDGNRYGSRTGSRGHFRTTREGYLRSNSREVCREYESVIVTRQKTETRTGVACSRNDGSWREVNSTEVIFRDGSSVRTETESSGYGNNYGRRPVPRPRPIVVPEPDYNDGGYGGNGSLSGYCPDYNHQQFYAAKEFAFSSTGLNLTTNNATQWALNYNQTHRCGTIHEYARQFAAVKEFAFSSSGLNKTTSRAVSIATQWVDRGNCGNSDVVQQLWSAYEREFQFAFSSSGLNMTTNNARSYAIQKLGRMSRCPDLLY
jgi:surface antigen